MLLIGAAGRKTGKTTLACSLIKKFKTTHQVIALKVTVIRERDGACPRGNEGCGVCTSLENKFDITEETRTDTKKDTARLLEAGAKRVFWLRVMREHLQEGTQALLKLVDRNALLICESNSLRHVVEPGLFWIIQNQDFKTIKSSAKEVMEFADEIILTDGTRFEINWNDVTWIHNRWSMAKPVTAVILAGGKSTRMGSDKSLLIHPQSGKPLIQNLFERIRPYFKEMIISSNHGQPYHFLDAKIVSDPEKNQGPMMGIISAMEISSHDLNMVFACDIPHIDISFMLRILRCSRNKDGAVPVTTNQKYEPLFAVYHKRILTTLHQAYFAGERGIQKVYPQLNMAYIPLDDPLWLKNINTREEYDQLREL